MAGAETTADATGQMKSRLSIGLMPRPIRQSS